MDHSLRGNGAGSRRRFQAGDEWEVGFFFGVRAAVEEPDGAGRVLQSAGVTDERGGVDGGSLAFAENVVSLAVRYALGRISGPLFQ